MSEPFSARDIAALVTRSAGVALDSDTVDTFQAGDADAIVRGVAVTMMPTLEVLERAVGAGCNLVISHEPAFYGHRDDTAILEREGDAVWRAKRDFIERSRLILWRFHDIPHLQRPDAITSGMVEELGWRSFQSADDDQLFTLPATTVDALSRELRAKLGALTLRVVGDGAMAVSRIALSPGCPGFEPHRHLLQRSDVEVLVMGEAFEWETIAYAADAARAGHRKALIILGHIPSEQGGMRSCAVWIRTLLPALPVLFLPTPEPFHTPA